MGRAKETFGKKEVRNKKLKKRKDKEARKQEKKDQGKNSFEDMLAYVDENGQICSEPPDNTKKEEINSENIEVSIPKGGGKDKNTVIQGKVLKYDETKGYGFISSPQLMETVFFHVNDCEDEVQQNDVVEFDTEKGPKGLKAINIKKAE